MFVKDKKRSHYCGELGEAQDGQSVIIMGWVDVRRDHGGLIFVDLRDRTGIVQVVFDPQKGSLNLAKDIRNEYVVALQGKIRLRPQGMSNSKIKTGAVEVEAESMEILSEAQTPPFQINDEKVHENLKLKYRYLELRSPRLQNYMKTRHQVMQLVRLELVEQGFLEIETPILFKSTPEGARDYLVPSRVHHGHFYALPQSPQTLKQLLMIGGYDKYFQIARCFRDEDLRADRQPEFSQIDIEMSFIDQNDIMAVNEKLLRRVWKTIKGIDVGPVQVMSYNDCMSRYGVDRPDLRISWELVDLKEQVKDSGFKVFMDAIQRGDLVKGLCVPTAGSFSRSQMDKVTALAKQMGAKGLVWIKSEGEAALQSPISKFVTTEKLQEIFSACGGKKGDAVFIVADNYKITHASLGLLRIQLAAELKAIDTSKDRFLWVTDFPLLDYSAEDKRWAAVHHPFTTPHEESFDDLLNQRQENFHKLKAKAYDLVCNGYEIAGGSIRIHNSKIQQALFKALGLGEQEVQNKFGFFNEALTYGTPPHGGIAWGLDRLLMILCGTDAIRDVIAFPKTTKASCLMSDAPSEVDRDQLLELGIRLAQKNLDTSPV